MASSSTLLNPPTAPGGARDRRAVTRVAALMVFVAATLAIAAALHLSGLVNGRSSPFDADHAGIAEAIICLVLATGAAAMLGLPRRARAIGVVVNALAIAGFVLGLTMTARGGHVPDIAYHLVILPMLVASLVVLLRTRPAMASSQARQESARRASGRTGS